MAPTLENENSPAPLGPLTPSSRCDALLQDELDVLIIEEGLRDSFSARMQDRLSSHEGDPLLVFCPAFDEESSDVDAYLSSVIKPAVGFEIRLA